MKLLKTGLLTAATLLTMTITSCSSDSKSNPLLEESTTPYGTLDFTKITPSDYEEAIIEGIKLHDAELKEISENSEAPTFENTIAALDRSGKILYQASQALGNLEAALGDTALMAVTVRITPLVSDHSTEILLNDKLWNRIKKVYESKDERTDLSPEAIRLIDETYLEFAESGANLEGADRDTFKQLSSKLSELTVKFSQNVTNEMDSKEKKLWVDEAGTKGLPLSVKNAAREAAREALAADGKEDDENMYLFTMFAPSYVPFIKYADNRDLREKLYKLYNSRNVGGEYDNTKLMMEIANTRLAIAKLMGKENFSQYRTQHTMAGTPENVMNLLNQLRENYQEPMRAELAEIQAFAQKSEGPDFKLMPWDYSYWSEKLKNEKYAFNDEDMKPYFELNNTIDGVLGLATKLYGYTFKENKDIPVYHPDVKAFEVYDATGAILGVLYADFYFRPGKGPGAWMTDFRPETKDDNGNREIPLISIVMNFDKPIGNEPVLMTPYEVGTFLHEFGHALHGLSSQATYQSLSGTNVYHDIVELFSQFNENYLTQKEFLDGFAKHYKTGDKMPEDLLERFIRSNQYGAAYACMRQLGFGFLDMAYYMRTEPFKEEDDPEEFEIRAQDPVRIFDHVKGCLFAPSFGHIFSGGYASGYYGYKWAEVLDADAFAAFKENGIFDPATAAKFHKMLESGGTVDPMTMYREFRGKDPSVDALLERDGIEKK